jgi:hypothetical protein
LVPGLAGKACRAVNKAGQILGAGKKALSGHLGDAINSLAGSSPSAKAATAVSLAAVLAWVLGGEKFVLTETAKLLGHTSSLHLGAAWFSSAYWRVAGVAALLTLPFLFAAAIQALMRSDLALLVKATFGYLPLAMLAVGIAAPLTMLLLAAADEMSSIVSTASGQSGFHFLAKAGAGAAVADGLIRAPFVAFLVALITVAAALLLWLELLVRQAAVYVVVLMLPLAFAAMVWPARRVWAIRSIEVLVALILAKFAMVAILALGGAALDHPLDGSIFNALAGAVLLTLGAFAPWALLRLLPLAELAGGAGAALSGDARGLARSAARQAQPDSLTQVLADRAGAWAPGLAARMRHDADRVESAAKQDGRGEPQALPVGAEQLPGSTNGSGPAAASDDGARGETTNDPSPGHRSAPSARGGDAVASNAEPTSSEPSSGMPMPWPLNDYSWSEVLGPEGIPPSSPPGPPPEEESHREDHAEGSDGDDPLPPPQEPQDGRL